MVTPWSFLEERASMEKYAFQLATELGKNNISYSILPVRVNAHYLFRIFLPLFTSWRVIFWKENTIIIQYAFFINFPFLFPFLRIAKYLCAKKIILEIHEHWDYLSIPKWMKPIVKFIDLAYCKIADATIVHNKIEYEVLKTFNIPNLYLWYHPIDDYPVSQKKYVLPQKISILMHWWIIRKKRSRCG